MNIPLMIWEQACQLLVSNINNNDNNKSISLACAKHFNTLSISCTTSGDRHHCHSNLQLRKMRLGDTGLVRRGAEIRPRACCTLFLWAIIHTSRSTTKKAHFIVGESQGKENRAGGTSMEQRETQQPQEAF